MDRIEKKKQEKEFRDFFLFSSISNMKTGMWVTLALFIAFRFITVLFFRNSGIHLYFLRFGIIIPFLIATLVVLYIRALHPWLHILLTIITLLSGVGIFIVGATSDIHEPGYQYYPIWVMLVIMGIFVFYRITFRNLMIIGGILILSFIMANIYNHFLRDDPTMFTVNLFFVISIGSLGYFISVYRNQSIREIFMKEKESLDHNNRLRQEVQERIKAQNELLESQNILSDSLDAIPDMIHVVDKDFNFVLFNSAFISMNHQLNLEEDVIGKNQFTVFPFLEKKHLDEMNHVFHTGVELITEEKTEINGNIFHTETRKIPIVRNHEVVQIMTIVRDISRKMEVEELKQKNLEQKEILLREIHHRVKNNLAIVISLLDMQVRRNPNPEFIKLSHDIEHRIRSMALIHEHLYKSDNLDRVPLDKYIIAITNGITRTYGSENIRTSFDIELVDVKIEIAMPLGLIANEILTNAFKYAFPDNRQGEIKIVVKGEESSSGLYRLRITDNGIGLPDSMSINEQSTMGMLIIRLLVDQIDARLVIDNHQGTSFSIIFKGIGTQKQKK